MSWAAVAGAAVGVVGSSLQSGGSGSQGGQTTQNTLDPRIAPYLYGQSGQGGLLGNVNNLYAQQSGQGGLNPMQNAGLEMQRQTLMDPAFTQGYGQMRNLGAGLLSHGVAGNPFTGGQGSFGGMPSFGSFAPPSFGNSPAPGMAQAGGNGGLISPASANIAASPGNLGFSAASQPIQQATAPPPAPLSQDDLRALLARAQQPVAPVPDSSINYGGSDSAG